MNSPAITFVLALIVGVACHVVARRSGLPTIVLLFSAGVALGPDGLGVIRPQLFGTHLFDVVGLAVAIILFEGGLNLRLNALRRESAAIRRLVTIGVALTGVGAALCAALVMDWSWRLSALFGSLVVVTGPTVIRPVLRQAQVRPRPATILEAEGVFNDPIGAIVAAVTLQVVATPAGDVLGAGLAPFLQRLGLGIGAGAAFAALLHRAQRKSWLPADLRKIATLAGVLMLFELCEQILSESGVVAVTVAGVVAANLGSDLRAELSDFKEQLSVGLIGLLFVMLAADVRIADIVALGQAGLLTVGLVVFVVRPFTVLTSLAGIRLPVREKLFLSWMGPRGIVAAAITSLATVHMDAQGMDGGAPLRALVFLTIGLSVLVQGGSASIVASLLGLRAGTRDRVVIFGATEIGLLLASILRERDHAVTLLEPDPHDVRRAQERGFEVVYGNELDPRTMARAHLGNAHTVIAATASSAENALFTRIARERFQVAETYVAIDASERGMTASLLAEHGEHVLFDGARNLERWNRRLRLQQVERRRLYFRPSDAPEPGAGDDEPRMPADALLIAVRHDGAWMPMHRGFAPVEGDEAVAVVLRSSSDATLAALEKCGWWQRPA